jgi:myo-inositol-1(or 4)-monophosphatase
MNCDTIVSVAHQVADATGSVLRKYAGHADIRLKSAAELVTQADVESEQTARAIILGAFPDHQILGEEEGTSGVPNSDSLWIIDPLDGTHNYAHGIPQFCVSIAYAWKGTVQVGLILDPNRQERFLAIRGQGAWLNDQRIAVSSPRKLQESIIATGFYYDRGELIGRTLDAIRKLFEANVRGIRRFGSAALDLAWVACGRFDGYFEYRLSPWDFAAGALLVTEAGGECCDRTGHPLNLSSQSVVAMTPGISDSLLACVRWPE